MTSKSVYEQDYEAIGGLKRLADAHGVSVLVLHHLRKAAADDPFDAVSGTLGLSGAADGTLVLQRASGRHDAVLHVTGRDVEQQELALRWDVERCLWSIAGDAQVFRLSPERRSIIQALEWADVPLTPKAIADAMGKGDASGRASVRRALGSMVRDGLIRGDGNYGYTSATAVTETQAL
jgi:hypothetical protein